MRRSLIVLAVVIVAATIGCMQYPKSTSFAWEGTLDEDAWVRVRNLNGRVEVRRSPDQRTIIGAEVKTGGRRATWVRDSADDGVTFCVVLGNADRADCEHLRNASTSGFLAWAQLLLTGDGSSQAATGDVLYVQTHARIDMRTI